MKTMRLFLGAMMMAPAISIAAQPGHDYAAQQVAVSKISFTNGIPRWDSILIGTSRRKLERVLKRKIEVTQDHYGDSPLETYGAKIPLPGTGTLFLTFDGSKPESRLRLGLVHFDYSCDSDGIQHFKKLKSIIESRIHLASKVGDNCSATYYVPPNEKYLITIKTDGFWFGFNDPPVD